MAAGGSKFNRHEREAKIAECSNLYLAGRSQVEIAGLIGVSQQQVSLYLKTLQSRWQTLAAEALEARKARELARLDRLEREYWLAWERSTQNAETTVNKAKTISLKEETEAGLIEVPALEREWTHTTRGQAGDPRFLDGVHRCIETRLKVVGGFAPVKHEVRTWQDEVVELLRTRQVEPAEVVAEYGQSMAADLFALAGISVEVAHDPAQPADA